MPPAPLAKRRRSGGCIWWVLGGCALILVLALAGAGLGAVSLYNSFKHYTCLPSDFPSYPGATTANYTFALNGPTPGNSCNMVYRSKDSESAVFDFYQGRLSTGGWQATATDPGTGQITFRNVKRAKTSRTVDVAAKNGYTEITIQLYSR